MAAIRPSLSGHLAISLHDTYVGTYVGAPGQKARGTGWVRGWSFSHPLSNQLSRGGTGDQLVHRAATAFDMAELAPVPTPLLAVTRSR